MNKEELAKLCEENFLENIKKYLKSETIFIYVDNLEKENKKQKEILDKAIEYIDTTLIEKGKTKLELSGNEIGTLLNILKGGENEK